MLIVAQSPITKKPIHVCINGQVNKDNAAYVQCRILFSHEKNAVLCFATKRMQLEIIMLGDSLKKTDKYFP